jgi:hypothetical protein
MKIVLRVVVEMLDIVGQHLKFISHNIAEHHDDIT